MGPFAALDLTDTCVAEIRALKYMAFGALGSLVAVPVGSKSPTDEIAWGMLGMEIGARRVDTLSLGKMHAKGDSLFRDLVREVTRVALWTFTF